MAASAAASAATASAGAANLVGTSSTSVAIGTGLKSFTASTAKSWVAGSWVIAFSAAGVSNYMLGRVTAYNSGTGALDVDVTGTNGSGTYTDWTITVAGPQGATGRFVASVGEATLSSNTTAGTGDRGKVIRCTSTFTPSFTAVATLGAGFGGPTSSTRARAQSRWTRIRPSRSTAWRPMSCGPRRGAG